MQGTTRRAVPGNVRLASSDDRVSLRAAVPRSTPQSDAASSPTADESSQPKERAEPPAAQVESKSHLALPGNGERAEGAPRASDGRAGDATMRGSSGDADDYPSLDDMLARARTSGASPSKLSRFERALRRRIVDVAGLRQLSWSGVPAALRPLVWQLLVGYRPAHTDRQRAVLHRKRAEYRDSVRRCLAIDPWADSSSASGAAIPVMGRTEAEQRQLRQILVDIPRSSFKVPLFQTDYFQRARERVLHVWAIRHPASGYVQGMDGLVQPFFAVYLSPFVSLDTSDVSHLSTSLLANVEADIYWSFTRMLDSVQDNFTPSQPGVQRMIFQFRELLHRLDESLVDHMESEGVAIPTFAHRFMNCILAREFSLPLVIRLWDTYLAEGTGADSAETMTVVEGAGSGGFRGLHIYVCAALILDFADRMRGMRLDELMVFLQRLPTDDWSESKLEEIIAQAYVYQSTFGSSPSHLR